MAAQTSSPRSTSVTSPIYDVLPGTRHIRLLKFDRAAERVHAKHAVSLSTFDLDKAPAYDALSYTWGDPYDDIDHDQDRKVPQLNPRIICNNVPLAVTQNLLDVLASLSAFWTEKDWLWIDAVCINQADLVERSQQVLLMGELYASAEQVIIWLGPKHKDFGDVTWAMADFPQFLEDYGLQPEDIGAAPKSLRDRSYWERVGVDPLPRFIRAAKFYYACRWFRRAWIFQEVFLARKAVVLCGSEAWDWKGLTAISLIFTVQGWTQELGGELIALYDTPTDFLPFALMNEVTTLKVLSDRASMGGLSDEIVRTQNHFHGVQNEEQLSFAWLHYLLISMHNRECQDRRDRIYAVLGIADRYFRDPDRPLSHYIKPDYTLPWTEICTSVGRLMIGNSRYLDILSFGGIYQDGEGRSLPSWCPNYCTARALEPLTIQSAPSQFDASICESSSLQSTQVFHDASLTVEGADFDVVEVVLGVSMNEIGRNGLWQELLNFCITLPERIQGVRRLEVLWRTLVVDRGDFPNVNPMRSPAAPELEHCFVSLIILMISKDLMQDRRDLMSSFQALSLQLSQLQMGGEASRAGRHGGSYLVEGCLAVLRVLTWSSSSDERSRRMAADMLSEVMAAAQPFRQLIDCTARGRRLFKTKRGLVGLAPMNVQSGDHVYVIANARVPFVLRPTVDQLAFQLLGDCYIHGFMKGEMLSDRWGTRDLIKAISLV